jgi:hypothetical protein
VSASPIETVTGKLPEDWQHRLFAGGILQVIGLPEVAALRATAERMACEAFTPHDPTVAHRHLDFPDYLDRAREMQRRFAEGGEVSGLFADLFRRFASTPLRDRFHLRVVPPGAARTERPVRSLPAHRDTWASNLMHQINWWAPVFPITAQRTIIFWPDYWSRPIRNNSAAWDLETVKACRSAGRRDYPHLPSALEQPDVTTVVLPIPKPDEILVFSGAHLHGTAPNTSAQARFSFETRTIEAGCAVGRAGAPNVDHGASGVQQHWFQPINANL